VAQTRRLVLDRHPKPGGLPRCQPQDAQHDGVVAVPGHAQEEVEQIARFKDLTDVQRSLLLSVRKEPGKYVEGVVLSDNIEALFRNVPPPLSLALAMTEKYEKASVGRLCASGIAASLRLFMSWPNVSQNLAGHETDFITG